MQSAHSFRHLPTGTTASASRPLPIVTAMTAIQNGLHSVTVVTVPKIFPNLVTVVTVPKIFPNSVTVVTVPKILPLSVTVVTVPGKFTPPRDGTLGVIAHGYTHSRPLDPVAHPFSLSLFSGHLPPYS
jgi:hypothetical protein